MAVVNEEDQQRDTLPPVEAHPESPPEDAEADSSTALVDTTVSDGVVEPSGEATPPTSQAEPTTKPWNLPPEQRWEELRRERDEARKREHQAFELLQQAAQRPVAPVAPATPQVDPWDGLTSHPDPATAQFYQQQKKLVEHAVRQGRDQAFQELSPVIQKLQQGQAAMTIKEFRKENPDIAPGSEEERLVMAYMNGQVDGVYHPIESARNNAVIRKLETEVKTLRARQAATPGKRAAARMESSNGIPASAGGPAPQGDWRQRGAAVVDQGGSLLDVARAVFGTGGKRRPA